MIRIVLVFLLLLLYGCADNDMPLQPEPVPEPTIERIPGEMWAQRESRDGNDRVIFEWMQMHPNGTVWLHWIEPAGDWVMIELDKIGNSHWLRFSEQEKKRPATEEEIRANP